MINTGGVMSGANGGKEMQISNMLDKKSISSHENNLTVAQQFAAVDSQ